jgi:thiamine-monophosphate kinase
MDDTGRDAAVRSEEAIIALLAPLAAGYPNAFGLKDDCALVAPPPGAELVLKTDPVAEGVHFMHGDAPEDIAWKALAVNVSDIVAKGAEPIAYLMALAFPEAPRLAWISRFVDGLHAAQAAFGCHLMGGDTDRRPGPLTIAITVLGSLPRGSMVQRTTAAPGDRLFVSGSVGDAALGLALLHRDQSAKGWSLSPEDAGYLHRRYRRPEPRLPLAPVLRRHAAAAMDISDGLVKDLDRLLRASGVAARVDAASVPLSPAARMIVRQAPDQLMRLLTGGDDYEVLAAVRPDAAAAFAAAAAAVGVAVADIGQVLPGPPALTLVGPQGQPLHLPAHTGWDHFR